MQTPPPAPLADPHQCLKSSGRGKHIGAFSYYHVALVETVPRVRSMFADLQVTMNVRDHGFNVVKLDAGERISFLLYEDFKVAFPALLVAISCHLGRGQARRTDFASRRNPPILHRKELLLPGSHPLVPEAERRTKRLESVGAFRCTTIIGTRMGWQRRLEELGVDADGRPRE